MSAKQIDVQKIVGRLADECFEAHRGAFWWDEGRRVAVAFGNDGYEQDPRPKAEVAAVRRLLAEEGGKELGFATDEDAYSWALVCGLPEHLAPEVVESVVWLRLDDRPGRSGCGGARLGRHPGRPQVGALGDAFLGHQANVARAVLERAGLV